jgi:hypothetical protein
MRLTGTMVRQTSEGSGFVRDDAAGRYYFIKSSQRRGADLMVDDRLSFEARPGRQHQAINIRRLGDGEAS